LPASLKLSFCTEKEELFSVGAALWRASGFPLKIFFSKKFFAATLTLLKILFSCLNLYAWKNNFGSEATRDFSSISDENKKAVARLVHFPFWRTCYVSFARRVD
ncbi:hypothetical protein M514_18075, partial [Trichuris suis]